MNRQTMPFLEWAPLREEIVFSDFPSSRLLFQRDGACILKTASVVSVCWRGPFILYQITSPLQPSAKPQRPVLMFHRAQWCSELFNTFSAHPVLTYH